MFSYGRHIHITGPARTGTTLMKNLMHCFEETYVIPNEQLPNARSVKDITISHPDEIIVTKLPGGGVGLYEDFPGLNVIFMVRDPRDMFLSFHKSETQSPRKVHWWLDKERRQPGGFAGNIDGLLLVARDPRTLAVKYEELVSEPDRIQKIISKRFRLTPKHSFSRGHELFPSERIDPMNFAMNGIRPPDTDSVGIWRQECYQGIVKDWLKENPEINRYIQEMGYNAL